MIEIVAKYEAKEKKRNPKKDKERISKLLVGLNLGNMEASFPPSTKCLLKTKNEIKRKIRTNMTAFMYLSLINRNIAGIESTRLLRTIYSASVRRLKADSFLLSPVLSKRKERERKLHMFPGVYLLNSEIEKR